MKNMLPKISSKTQTSLMENPSLKSGSTWLMATVILVSHSFTKQDYPGQKMLKRPKIESNKN